MWKTTLCLVARPLNTGKLELERGLWDCVELNQGVENLDLNGLVENVECGNRGVPEYCTRSEKRGVWKTRSAGILRKKWKTRSAGVLRKKWKTRSYEL